METVEIIHSYVIKGFKKVPPPVPVESPPDEARGAFDEAARTELPSAGLRRKIGQYQQRVEGLERQQDFDSACRTNLVRQLALAK